MQFQVWMAQQTAGGSITDAQMAEAEQRMAQWRAYSDEVQACAAKNHSLLDPAMRDSALARMKQAQDSTAGYVSDWKAGKMRQPPKQPATQAPAAGDPIAADH